MPLLAASLSGLFTVGMWASLAGLVLTGAMSTAAAGTAIVASQTSGRALNSLVRYSTVMFHHGLYLNDYYTFIAAYQSMTTKRGDTHAGAPHEVTLENASYTYPGEDKPALYSVSLTLRRGMVIAIVGENGAGKVHARTTARRPDRGRQRWQSPAGRNRPGHRRRRVGLAARRPRPATARPLAPHACENITLGQPREHGDERVWEAADRVGMGDVLRALPDRLDTLLARSVWGGHELSGGQWQRIACARALHRQPVVLILDEPTSETRAVSTRSSTSSGSASRTGSRWW